MSSEVVISDDNFIEEVIESDIPVLVDFWSEWCGPCKMIAPILEDIAEDYVGKIKLAKVNIDEIASLAAKYDITSIPTLLLFKNGEVVDSQMGVIPREGIENMFVGFL